MLSFSTCPFRNSFRKSDDEKLFLDYIVFENDSFSEFKDLKKWNINVVEVKEAKNSGKKPFKADIDDIIRNYTKKIFNK